MDADTPLWKAHDISQQLQDKLETLPGVERAFVHVDHETTHRPVSYLTSYESCCFSHGSVQEHRKYE
jgi:divalent metal cation (Fe/Co/Zn/Cd) transporter